MRWMKSSEPSAKPTTMPSVRSRKTTSRKVTSSTSASPREARTQRGEGVSLHHVPGDHRQHAGQRRERDVAGERRGQQHEEKQEQRMQHAGDRAVRAGAHIGGGAGDGAGDADAAEQGGADVGDALRHQLAVGAVPAPGHAVGDHGREQRFDGAEQREGERVRQHRDAPCAGRTPAAPAAARQRGMPPKRVPMVSTGRPSAPAASAASATAISMPGQAGRQRFSADDGGDRQRGHGDGRELTVPAARAERRQLRQQRAGLLAGERQAEQVLRSGWRR